MKHHIRSLSDLLTARPKQLERWTARLTCAPTLDRQREKVAMKLSFALSTDARLTLRKLMLTLILC